MRSNHNTRNGCHKDISQGQNGSITHTSTAQENFILGSPFVSCSLKNYPAPMAYVACLVLCFQYCYQEIKISQLNISSKSGNSKPKLSISSRAETNSGGEGGTGEAYLYQLQQPPSQGLILVN